LELALARIRNNLGQLRGPRQLATHEGLGQRIAGRVKVAHLQYYLGAALSVALVGIGVNALLLQRERHPAPLFGSAAPKPTPTPAPAPASPQKQAATEDNAPAQSAAAVPPARPAEAAASAPPAEDPIGDLLNGETHSDGSRLVLAAQTALAKLGYAVKADGKEGAATQQALKEFEHAHGLAPATEINERLVKQLNQATRGGAH
jgi:hypothetical protein